MQSDAPTDAVMRQRGHKPCRKEKKMNKPSDFELLKQLQSELISALEERKKATPWVLINRGCCRAKIRRLRLLIGDVMFRIERKCAGGYKRDREGWE